MIAKLEDIDKALHRWLLISYNRLTQLIDGESWKGVDELREGILRGTKKECKEGRKGGETSNVEAWSLGERNGKRIHQ
jgi:hypothetical protein